MAANEYRRLAAECLLVAEDVTNAQSRNLLIHMSQSWLRLAHQSEKNLTTDTPPSEATGSAVVQHRHIQPKKEA